MAYPDHMRPIEARICDLILQGAFSRGWKITVRDEDGELGEGPMRNDDWASITADIAATSMTRLWFSEPGELHKLLGWILLVHGNDEDLIGDHSTAPVIGDLADEVLKAWADPNGTRLVAAGAITIGAVPPVTADDLEKIALTEGEPGLLRELTRFCIRLSIPLRSADELLLRFAGLADAETWLNSFLAADHLITQPLEGDIA